MSFNVKIAIAEFWKNLREPLKYYRPSSARRTPLENLTKEQKLREKKKRAREGKKIAARIAAKYTKEAREWRAKRRAGVKRTYEFFHQDDSDSSTS
ncbi:unnamed protein product [Caenorhabditis brenneri]